MKKQLKYRLVQLLQNKKEILLSYYRDGIFHAMYINALQIESMTKKQCT